MIIIKNFAIIALLLIVSKEIVTMEKELCCMQMEINMWEGLNMDEKMEEELCRMQMEINMREGL